MGQVADGETRHHVDLADPVDLVAEKFHADGVIPGIYRENLHRIAPDPEHVPLEGDVVPAVSNFDELFEKLVPVPRLSHPKRDDHVLVVDGVAQAVDAADRRHDNHIPPLEERRGGRVPEPLDLVVDGAVLLDVRIRVGDIGFRLVVVVVGDKKLHRVFREELLELAAQLGGQGLVMDQHQSRALEPLDDLRHRVRLAGARDAQERLLLEAKLHTVCQRHNSLRLVAGGRIFADDL